MEALWSSSMSDSELVACVESYERQEESTSTSSIINKRTAEEPACSQSFKKTRDCRRTPSPSPPPVWFDDEIDRTDERLCHEHSPPFVEDTLLERDFQREIVGSIIYTNSYLTQPWDEEDLIRVLKTMKEMRDYDAFEEERWKWIKSEQEYLAKVFWHNKNSHRLPYPRPQPPSRYFS